jgi:cGMP-dependent protein kinase
VEGFEHRSDRRRAEAKKRLEERGRDGEGDASDGDDKNNGQEQVEIRYEYLEPPIKVGSMRKKAIKGVFGIKNCKQRWFRLEAGELRYYDKKSMKPSRLKGVVSLKGGASVTRSDKHDDRDNELQINMADGQNLVLKCDDGDTAAEWKRAFDETIRIFDGAAAQYKDKKRKRNIAITTTAQQQLALQERRTSLSSTTSTHIEEHENLSNLTKSEEAVASIDKALQGHFLLGELDRDGHDALIQSMVFTSLLPGDVVFWQNTWGTAFYVVEQGRTQVVKDGEVVADLPAGTGFGELALVNDVLRTATIRASIPCRLWSIDRSDFREILSREENLSRERKVAVLQNIDLFAKLNFKALGQVADSLRTTFFDEIGTTIFKQGEVGDKFYIMRDGSVSVQVDRIEVAVLNPGDAFGERALIEDEPRNATITTNEDNVVCYVLDRDQFNDLLGQHSNSIDEDFARESLAKVQMFKGLSHGQIRSIAENLTKEVFTEGKLIFHQGEVGDKFYVLASGTVKVIVNHQVVGEILPGNYFGEKALMSKDGSGERAATILAASPKVITFALGRDDFVELMGPVEAIMEEAAKKHTQIEQASGIMGRMSRMLSSNRNSTESSGIKSKDQRKYGTFQTRVVAPLEIAGLSELHVLQTLGKGEFSVVSMVVHEVTGDYYALKRVPKEMISEKMTADHSYNNRNFLLEFGGGIDKESGDEVAAASHFFPLLYATFSDAANIFYVSEVCRGGDLHNVFYHTSFLAKTRLGGVPETVAAFYVATALSALQFMHSKDVIFRNLRMENMVISDDGFVKFSDLSFCKQMDTEASTTNTMCGCGEYISPEMVLAKPYNRGVDYWALGVLTFELLTGQTPFEDLTLAGIFQNVLNCKKVLPKALDAVMASSDGAQLSAAVVNFMESLLEEKFSMRMGLIRGGVTNIWAQPFLKSKNFSAKAIQEFAVAPPYVPFPEGEEEHGHDVKGFEDFGEEIEDFTFYEDVVPYDGADAEDYDKF